MRIHLRSAFASDKPLDERIRVRISWLLPMAVAFFAAMIAAPRALSQPLQQVDRNYVAKIDAKIRQVSNAVELMEQDIVAELVGTKEKQLFQKVDQVLHESSKLEKVLESPAPNRRSIYMQFDSLDTKVSGLVRAVPELAPKHLLIQRGAERIRSLMDDLHFVISQGDNSPARLRQVLTRQAKAMRSAAQQMSMTAQYALATSPGRGELLAEMKKLVTACKPFEEITATRADLEKCRKEFTALNNTWSRVVEGISLLPPAENVYLLRGALRADLVHERLYRALEIKGERPHVTIRI